MCDRPEIVHRFSCLAIYTSLNFSVLVLFAHFLWSLAANENIHFSEHGQGLDCYMGVLSISGLQGAIGTGVLQHHEFSVTPSCWIAARDSGRRGCCTAALKINFVTEFNWQLSVLRLGR